MIEQALYEHLSGQEALKPYLALYDGEIAVFNQEAPADVDPIWGDGPQYGRIVFAEDLQGDPERTMGGLLSVDILCKEDEQYPEEIEPLVRQMIHGWFFSNGTFTVAAQWKNSAYFTEPGKNVTGVTLTFDLLGFPVLSCDPVDVVGRLNAWTAERFPEIHVLNYAALPSSAWQPGDGEAAIYWRVAQEAQTSWIPTTFQHTWRTATAKGHIFAADLASVGKITRAVTEQLYTDKRLLREGESPIMVNTRNTFTDGADALRTGQMTVEATYGIITYRKNSGVIRNINY